MKIKSLLLKSKAMADSLLHVLMLSHDMTEVEAKNLIGEMAERVEEGEDPESLLNEEGLEPDYVFDLIDAVF